jgi:tRNA-dihydrouridine synthase 3
MSEQADAQMGGVTPEPQHAEVAADASNIATAAATDDGERASKRLKMNDSAPSQSVPGEGLHDAPAGKDEKAANGEKEQTQESKSDSKTEHVDGRTKGVAPIKKE